MRLLIVGIVLSAFGIFAYVGGLFVAYPGRAFSLTGVMAGLTLLAIGRSTEAAS
jgi:hypothetical protein